MPTEEPEATPAPEEDDWKPHGEAWAILGDGTKLDGRLQDILNELSGKEREDEEAEVFTARGTCSSFRALMRKFLTA